MPIYEYECEECGEIHEKSQRISEPPLASCPECSGSLRKLISRSSFQLKGGGWYAEGYSGASNKKSCKAAPACGSSAGSSPAVCPKKSSDVPCCAA